MEIIDRGHRYRLSDGTEIQFIKRVEGDLISQGTTNEELLEVLLDRTKMFQESENTRCEENAKGISAMAKALFWFKRRLDLRKEQGVYRTDEPHVSE